MTKSILPVSFFFGANNKTKYYSLYNEIYNPYIDGNHIILKGGPGTGKSTIMKKVSDKLESKGLFVERGYCSADPNSLDAVIAPEINFSILDGTAPHIFDPTLPGVNEHIVDLSVAWDKKLLKEFSKEIGEKQKENQFLHKKAVDFLKTAAVIDTENAIIVNEYSDMEKIERYALRLSKRLIPDRKNRVKGKVYKRFLSGITPEGVVTQYDTIVSLSEKIITIDDEFSVCSPYIEEVVSAFAVNSGYDIYKCYCPLFPDYKPEHIIIPELKLTLFSQNEYHNSLTGDIKKISTLRFFDKDGLNKNKEKLEFGRAAKKELIDETIKKLSKALSVHDELEKYYINATNFDVINDQTEKILNSIK